jgi:lipoprotein-anchoring transpeptidase ErfK/SrfK
MSTGSRAAIGFAAIFGLAGCIGEAAAQYDPPGPPAPRPYYSNPLPPPDADLDEQLNGEPPGLYGRPDRRGPYGHALDPRDSRRPLFDNDPRYDRQASPNDPYGPARRPYFVPDEDSASTRFGTARRDDRLLVTRPPAEVGTEGAPPTTGSVRTPGAAAPLQPPYATESYRGPSGQPPAGIGDRRGAAYAALPPEDRPEDGPVKELPAYLKRQLVDYPTKEPAGTIVIDTQHTYLYLVLGKGKAMRYGIGVGREGFTWAGRERISKMAEWPDWFPPKEMIERQPYLPRMMAGGQGNPLGARALYLGKTIYRIHGTNQPSTIGQFVSSGCIRMLNEDAEDLYGRVQVGTRVVVLPGRPPASAAAARPITR